MTTNLKKAAQNPAAPIPLSWDYAPEKSSKEIVRITCAYLHVSSIHLIVKNKVDIDGNVQPCFKCANKRCKFEQYMRLIGWNNNHSKRPLHCIALKKWTGSGWVNQLEYLHADDSAMAKAIFVGTLQGPAILYTRIIAVAPVIGYFVDDNQGRVLSV